MACALVLMGTITLTAYAQEPSSVPTQPETPENWQQVMEDSPMTQQEFQEQTAQGWLSLALDGIKQAAQEPIRMFLKLFGVLLLLAAAKTICQEPASLQSLSIVTSLSYAPCLGPVGDNDVLLSSNKTCFSPAALTSCS